MSVEYKKDNNGKCPVMHGGVTKSGESNTSRLWPNSINLDILHQHDTKKDTGEFKKGFIKAELDIIDNLWFFDCHFQKDPVMPGCLGLDAMWQLVGFYLGWLGNPGRGRALGVGNVKFTGEVLKNVKLARYEINILLKKFSLEVLRYSPESSDLSENAIA